MAGTSFPVARLLELGIPVTWQEAVAVVNAADVQSTATGRPITLEHCHITADGDVHLLPAGSKSTLETISSLHLLGALMAGQASPGDLRILAASVDRSRPDSLAADRRLRVDVRWCLSANPKMDVARLAVRALLAHPEAGQELAPQTNESRSPLQPLAEPKPPRWRERDGPRRRPAVAIRWERVTPGVALALAAVLLVALGGGAAATSAILVDDGSSRASHSTHSVSTGPGVLPTLLTP